MTGHPPLSRALEIEPSVRAAIKALVVSARRPSSLDRCRQAGELVARALAREIH